MPGRHLTRDTPSVAAAAKAAISTATGYRIETDPRLHAPLRLPSPENGPSAVAAARPAGGIFEQEGLPLPLAGTVSACGDHLRGTAAPPPRAGAPRVGATPGGYI